MAPVPGGAVHYRCYEPADAAAARRTPLVMIHGGPGGSHGNMHAALHLLAEQRPLIFYDQLGSHFSPAIMTPDLMTVGRFASELPSLLDHLHLEKAAILGHSWGGTVALECALACPQRSAALILSSPLIGTARWTADCAKLLARLPGQYADIVKTCEENGATDSPEYAAADAAFSDRHFCRTTPLPDSLAKDLKKTNRLVYAAMWGPSEFSCKGSLRDIDYFPRLRDIAAPALLICGEYDMATPETMAQAQAMMKNARLSVLPGAGHVPYYDANDAYRTAVSSFLSTLENPAPQPKAAPAP